MAFKLKDFDYKQFLLQRGEQVGLGVAIAIASLMVVFGLFIPALSTKGAGTNANELNSQSQQKKQQMEGAAPSADERLALASFPKSLRTDRKTDAEDPDTFRVAGASWFSPSALDDTKRRAPVVRVPREFRSTVELAQVASYLLKLHDGKPDTILVLEGSLPASGGRPGAGHPGQNFFGAAGGGGKPGGLGGSGGGMPPGGMPPGGGSGGMMPPGGGSGGMMPPGGGSGDGRPGGGRPGGMGMMMPPGGGMPGGQETGDTKAKIKPVKVEQLDEYLQKYAKDNARLAEDVLPLRMVVVTASFPYKEQLEEFKEKLHAPSVEALFADKQSTPEFLPFNVERRELKPDGTFTGWQKLDLARTMRPVALMTGLRFEQEDPALEAVSFPGLVMRRPLQYKENQTDRIDLQLKLLEETRKEIKDALATKVVKPRNPFQTTEIDPFNPHGLDETNAPGMPGGAMPPGMPTMGGAGGMKPGGGKPQLGGGAGTEGPASAGMSPSSAAGAGVVPKYCLVRFLDVTVEPGKTYGYRMQIRMTNPNKDRKDVAWASLAKEEDIRSEWIEVKDDSKSKDPDRIYVQPESFAYVADQALLDPKGFNGNRTPPKADQVVMQVHRWLDYVFPDYPEKGTGFPVGEWSIGERMLINRGEFIGRAEQVEIPRRLVMEERFGMAVHKKNKKIPVIFDLNSGYGDTLLVDFQGGKMTHTRPPLTEDGKSQTVDDKAPIEVLLMAPNGRLLVRDSVADSADEERKARHEAWQKRLKEVKENKPSTPKPGGPGAPGGSNPFGGS
jgi:hypothetical protein